MHLRIERWLIGCLVLLLSVGLAACNGGADAPVDEQPAAEETAPEDGVEAPTEEEADGGVTVPADRYVAVTIGEPESLDPAWTYETSGAGIEQQIYEGVTAFDREQPDAFIPGLATEWDVSDDQLTYTFNIRDGVTFHAGGTLEPHDVAYSLQRAMLQDRVDGPMWLFLEPFLGTSSIADYTYEQAGVDPDAEADDEEAAEGEEGESPLAALPEDVLIAVCEDVKAAVSADDEAGTVTMTVQNPTPWLLQLLSQPWGGTLDQEWMAEQGDWNGDCATWVQHHDPSQQDTILFDQANGTGPYMLEDWIKGEEIILAANENYWRTEPMWDGGPSGAPAIKQVVIQAVEEWGQRLAKLETGEADTVNVPRANIEQVEDHVYSTVQGGDDRLDAEIVNEDGFLKLYRDYPLVSATAAMFNFDVSGTQFIGSGQLDGQGVPPDFFSDINVRRGFSYCFDWETFIADALAGEGFQTRGPIIEGLQGYSSDSEIYEFDLARCEEELALAWDGVLPETGFAMTIAFNEGNEARQTVARILAENLNQVNPNYQVEVISMEWPSFLEARRAESFPISVSGWLEDYHDASNWVHPFMHSSGAYSRAQNFPDDLQTQFDDLINQGLVETDDAAREEIYAQLQQLAIENAVDIFLYQATGRFYVNRAVDGWYNNPLAPSTYYYALSKSE